MVRLLEPERNKLFFMHYLPHSVHDLLEQVPMNLNSSAFHNFLYSAFTGKSLVSVWIIPDHFNQLMSSDEVVQYNYVL